MGGTLDEFETKMHEIFNNNLIQESLDNLIQEFFELSDEEQNNFFEKYTVKKEEEIGGDDDEFSKLDEPKKKFVLNLKVQKSQIKNNKKVPEVEINEHALIDFGGLNLVVGISLLVFGIISVFLFSPIAWGLCLSLGFIFSIAGGFSIYKATKKNELLNELSKKENVQDLHDKFNKIEEEDINEKLNISNKKDKKSNDNMNEIPSSRSKNSNMEKV